MTPGLPSELVLVQIDRLASGGDGVGRLPDGRVVFVPFVAPGDRVRVRCVEEHARFVRGRCEEILEPGPGRAVPRCPVFGRCGGCAWQHLSYPTQLSAKAAILKDALERIGGFSLPEPPLMASPDAYAYRHRCRVLANPEAVGFRERRSRELCGIESCPVLVPPLNHALSDLAATRDSTDALAGTQEWELSVGSDGRARAAPLLEDGPTHKTQFGVLGERLRVSGGVFVQANALLFEALAEAVCGAACAGSAGGDRETLVELYAGAGFLTLPLARRFGRIHAVESAPAAARDLVDNLRAAKIRHVEVLARPVEETLSDLARARPRVVVLDPPRRGLVSRKGDLCAGLAGLEARRIVYLSCDPATLARDCRRLGAHGYALDAVAGFDLFPQTPHVEALAVLERSGELAEEPATV